MMQLVLLLFIAAPILSFINTTIISHSIGGEFRKSWKYFFIICVCVIVLLSVVEYKKIYIGHNEYSYIPLLIYWQVTLYPFLLFKHMNIKIMYSCVLYVLIITFLESICTYAFLSDSIFSSLTISAAIDVLFGIIILALLIFATKHMYTDAMLKFTVTIPKHIFIIIYLYLIFVPTIMQSLVFSKNATAQLPSMITQHLSIARLVFGIFAIIVLVVIFSLLFEAVANYKYEEATKFIKTEIKNQIHYYKEINQIQHEMRAFRHDIKAQILCIRALVSAKQSVQAIDCLDKILGKAETSTKCFDTGNNIIDSLLTDKQQLATQYNTNIVFIGCLPKEEFDLLDLCIITSNAIDNAIEACAKDSTQCDKEIIFESRLQQGYLVMRFQNPTFQKVNIIRNAVITTKSDKIHHGFGIYNMKQIVKRNNGDFKMHLDKNSFLLEIALHL